MRAWRRWLLRGHQGCQSCSSRCPIPNVPPHPQGKSHECPRRGMGHVRTGHRSGAVGPGLLLTPASRTEHSFTPTVLVTAFSLTPHRANQPNPLTRLIQRSHREGAKGGVAGCCTCMAGASYQKADALIRSSTISALSSHAFIFTQRAKRSTPSPSFPPPSFSAHRRGPYYPFFLVTEWPAMFCSAL